MLYSSQIILILKGHQNQVQGLNIVVNVITRAFERGWWVGGGEYNCFLPGGAVIFII